MLLAVIGAILTVASAQHQPNCASGRSGQVIVHLFEWKWNDIANECENVLGPKGFCGVQVSPPNEHRIVTSPHRPWWERYQPISYKLDSRSGSRADFINMVQRCNAAGVRIYIDAVINHMAGVDSGTGHGSGGSYYNTQANQFDGVPFGPYDFGQQCSTSNGNIQNYGDADQVRNCRLLGLLDLDGGSSYVRDKIAGFFNDMLEIGIDGYRIDAAKHMWPGDIQGTLDLTRDSQHGGRPYVFQEVIDLYGSEPIKAGDYVYLGQVTEFKFGLKMGEIFKSGQVKLTHLESFGSSWGMLADSDALVFVDNHDNQRGHGGGGSIITYKDSWAYKMAIAFMLSWPYGVPRVMSSYDFHEDWTGPPDYGPNTDGPCQNGWICEHRWRSITNMVAWRNSAGSSGVENWWSNGNNQIAYSRGGSTFITFNKEDGYMNEWLSTGLPAGVYCDVISGEAAEGGCTGHSVTVHDDGTANIVLDGSAQEPFLAIHVGAKSDSDGTIPDQPVTPPSVITTPGPPPEGLQRTIVFINKATSPGQDVFLRGGCGGSCTIPVTYQTKSGSHYTGYNAWRKGDTLLDWTGAEAGQGSHLGQQAQGSPMVWTTDNPVNSGYDSSNRFGDHMWMWDVYMDCSLTNDGWFEVKGIMGGQWENDVQQFSNCDGTVGGRTPASSNNHIARCGFVNKFDWGTGACTVDVLRESRSVQQDIPNLAKLLAILNKN